MTSPVPAAEPDSDRLRAEVRQSALLLTLSFAVLALVATIGRLLAHLG